MAFEPEDPAEAAFHEQFGALRDVVVQMTAGLTQRIKRRVAHVDRPDNPVSDLVVGSFVELFNMVSRAAGLEEDSDDERE